MMPMKMKEGREQTVHVSSPPKNRQKRRSALSIDNRPPIHVYGPKSEPPHHSFESSNEKDSVFISNAIGSQFVKENPSVRMED